MHTTNSFTDGLSCLHYFPSRTEILKHKFMKSNFLAAAGTQLRINLVLSMEPEYVMLGKAIQQWGDLIKTIK